MTATVDSLAWPASLVLTLWLRMDFAFGHFLPGALLMGAVALVSHLGLGATIGPYSVRHSVGSVEEMLDLTRTTLLVGAGLLIWGVAWQNTIVPRGVPVLATAIVLVISFAVRVIARWIRLRSAGRRKGRRIAVVFGAGEAGRLLLRSIAADPHSPIAPIALLDDDPGKQRLRVEGVRVRGTRSDIATVAQESGADLLVVAIPSADGSLLRDLSRSAERAGLEVLSLPSLSGLMGRVPTVSDLDSLDLADFLGRRPVQLDSEAIEASLRDRIVLVTGAGGSIGSEICRQVAPFGPRRLFLLDRDESGLHAVKVSLDGNGLLDGDDIVLANIREAGSMHRVFDRIRPDVVFHAAALKHLPILENHPVEAWQTNVLGTLNVLEAAASVGVRTFVNISTDKAANPESVLGHSKRIGERLTADYARRGHGCYVSVRFGNVLGSRGSVLHAFMAQLQSGGPITVTHPDVERFFMLIPEASQLVLQAAAMGASGEVMVLEMGDPVRIVEVARTLIRSRNDRSVDIVFTGLRPGEKLREDLFDSTERPMPTGHELVHQVRVPPLPADQVRGLAFTSELEARCMLIELAGARTGLRSA